VPKEAKATCSGQARIAARLTWLFFRHSLAGRTHRRQFAGRSGFCGGIQRILNAFSGLGYPSVIAVW
jgi:hypothetical protein